MKFADAIDAYLADQRLYGRINSKGTEVSYRSRLEAHCDDVNNRDPRKTGREDVKRTLRRWSHPNTRNTAHAILTSFYDWTMHEGLRDTNPARQVRRAKARKPDTYRLTRNECIAILDAAETWRDSSVAHLGLLAGVRNAELRGLQLRHFARPGYIHITPDIGKGGKGRWIPVLDELAPIVAEIHDRIGPNDFIFCARRTANPPVNTRWIDYPDRPGSPQAVWRLVVDLARKAGIAAHVHPHLLRHGFGDHIARYAGLRVAQHLLGHEDVSTTQGTYVGEVSLDELTASVQGFTYRPLSPPTPPETPLKATTGIEPVDPANNATQRDTGQPEGAAHASNGHQRPARGAP